MNNATMTDILALTDALLEAGWTRGQMVSSRGEYCLLGAIRAAIGELDLEEPVGYAKAAHRLIAAGLPDPLGTLPSPTWAAECLMYYNDRSWSSVRVRALVQEAAQSLIK